MILKYTATVFLAAALAATTAVGISAVGPDRAEAAGNTVKSCTGKNITLKAEEKQTLNLHNKERRERGRKALCIHPQLQKAARAHSVDMIRRDYFSHITKGTSRDSGDRMRAAGYRYRVSGENIGLGEGTLGTPAEMFNVNNPNVSGPDNWMDSPAHRPNILDRRYREVGIGIAKGTLKHEGDTYRDATVYTVDFGVR